MKQNRKNRSSDVVTSSHHDSEEEESVDDSGEDWQPEKVSFDFSYDLIFRMYETVVLLFN